MKRYLLLILLSYNFTLFSQEIADTEWLTRFEKSGYLATPRYNETMEYFARLADFSDFAHLFTFGISPQGRKMYCLLLSRDSAVKPVDPSLRSRPVILIINGIHSGEIEGKDASMLLMREILVTGEKKHLIENVDVLVVPIFSVDGHERFDPYNRINQNGPEEMGWRTTAQNLNLNRDWMKADAPEMQSMLQLINKWEPDFIIDTHATNGADYQYTMTYILERHSNLYGETTEWLSNIFIPFMESYIEERGYPVFPYVSMREWFGGVRSGISGGVSSPRFSSGYAAVRNRPGIVVETHMSKRYQDRVYSTKYMIEAILEYTANNPDLLLRINRRADNQSIKKFVRDKRYLPLNFILTDDYREKGFKGIRSELIYSELAGGEILKYTGEKIDKKIRYFDDVMVTDSVIIPEAYLIPQEWVSLIERIKLHGIKVETIKRDTVLQVTRYRFTDVSYASSSFEGRQSVDVEYESYPELVTVPQGTYYIPAAQRGVRILAHLMEPKSPDSFLRWGFFNTIFERKEYFELYVMEPTAREMIQENPALKIEFMEWLEDNPGYRDNPYQRLYFFYLRSPYYDDQLNLYPVMRVE